MLATTDLAVLTRLVAVPGREVVDVGCGGGSLARGLSTEGARVTGVEISETQLSAARAGALGVPVQGVDYVVGRAEALPLPDSSQDLVVFMRSLHHVPIAAMGQALAEARRVLRPEGAVYVAEPLAEGDWFELQSIIEGEAETRAAAQAALAACADQRLARTRSERYETETVLVDADAFAHRMQAVDPERAELLQARAMDLRDAFARLGTPVPGGRAFTHAHRADVLTPVLGTRDELEGASNPRRQEDRWTA
jgi:ubiquinone/menaquinone biosynthesis C-methylase UbiE